MRALLPLWMVASVAVSAQKASDYRKYAGRTVPLCGSIVTYAYPGEDGAGCDLRLDIASPHWKPLAYILVSDDARAAFAVPPEEFLTQQVCATGLVQLDKKQIAHIVVTKPEQITIAKPDPPPPFGRGASRPCEKGAKAPKATRKVRPSYTNALLASRAEDRLLLEAVVGVDGTVTEVRTVYGMIPEMHEIAQRAIRQWRFRPGTLNGQPVPMIVQILMTFTLRG